MARHVLQDRNAQVREVAATLNATVAETDETNAWEVAVAGKQVGHLRYDARARVWLAKAGTKSTVGDVAGCLRFVVQSY